MAMMFSIPTKSSKINKPNDKEEHRLIVRKRRLGKNYGKKMETSQVLHKEDED